MATPRPPIFDPSHAPVGVELRLDAYKTTTGQLWWKTRPVITPRLQLVHTNGAENEGSIESAINWGNRDPAKNTHPHYQVDRHRAAKLVPSDRRAIGNATDDGVENVDPATDLDNLDASWFSLVIETADEGWPTANRPNAPGGTVGFIGEQHQMIAEILAYESILHGIPLHYPAKWYEAGTACHTEPFGYPFWTIQRGKPCPGATKKLEMQTIVLPLALRIAAEWTDTTPPPEDPMTTILIDPVSPTLVGLFTQDCSPVSPETLAALKAAGPVVTVVQDHPHWDAVCRHKMGEVARQLYGDTPGA